MSQHVYFSATDKILIYWSNGPETNMFWNHVIKRVIYQQNRKKQTPFGASVLHMNEFKMAVF